MRRVYVIILLLLLVLVVGVALAAVLIRPDLTVDRLRQRVAVEGEEQINSTVRVFVRNPYKDDYGVSRIPGYVDNLSTAHVASVTMKITLYEKEDRKEVVTYEVLDVPANARKTFDANAGIIGGARTAQVEVQGVEVFK